MKVAAIGDNCMDVYPRLGRAYPTGNTVDFAVNMQKLGLPTAILSTTGIDEYGHQMRAALASEGLDLSHFYTGQGATAVTYMDPIDNDRIHCEYIEGVLAEMVFSPADIDFTARHDLVHSAFWGKAEEHLAALGASGAAISFDYATKKDDPLVQKTLPYVDYAFFSFSGAQEEALDYLRAVVAAGPQVAIATLGSQGSLAYDGIDLYNFGIYPARVENTVGAGDAFIAGFMYARLNGCPIEGCLQTGAQTAARVVEVFEPWVKS